MAPPGPAFISGIGIWEILVVLLVALIIFGPRLPEVARSVGKGYLEFRRGLRSLENEIEFADADVEVSEPSRKKPAEAAQPAGGPNAGSEPATPPSPAGEEGAADGTDGPEAAEEES